MTFLSSVSFLTFSYDVYTYISQLRQGTYVVSEINCWVCLPLYIYDTVAGVCGLEVIYLFPGHRVVLSVGYKHSYNVHCLFVVLLNELTNENDL